MRNVRRRCGAAVAGFTLVETLVASGILVLVLGCVVTAFVFAMSTVSRATVDAERIKTVNKVAGRFQQCVEEASSAKLKKDGSSLELTGESPAKGSTKVTLYTERDGGEDTARLLLQRKKGQAVLLAEGISDRAVFEMDANYARVVVSVQGKDGTYDFRTGSLLAGPTAAEAEAMARGWDDEKGVDKDKGKGKDKDSDADADSGKGNDDKDKATDDGKGKGKK